MSELKREILHTAKIRTLLFSCFFLFGCTMLSTYHYVQAAFADARDYYTLSETGGPFEVGLDADGHVTRGVDNATFSAGQRVGWLSSLCAAQGVSYTAHVAMVMLAQDGLPEREVVGRSTVFPATDHRCGAKIFALAIPEDSVAGLYEIRRSLDFRVGTAWPLHEPMTSIAFRLQGKPALTASPTAPFPSTK